MKIGVIVAMDKELALLLHLLENPNRKEVNGFEFHTGTIGQAEITATKCGIGKVNAAIGTMTLIDNFTPDLVINTGVAGGTGNNAGILDIVVGTRIAYHDVWCGPGTQWGDAAGCPRFFKTTDKVSSLSCLSPDETVKHGLIASGDIFVSDPAVVARIKELYPDVNAVDMESASIAHVCYMRQTPFACIRVISDTPGAEDNIAQYENFWEDVPKHTFEKLHQVILELTA